MNVCYSISKGDMSGKVKGMADIAPLTYNEAMSESNVALWGPAVKVELDAMGSKNVWTIVPRTKDMKTIPFKWLFNIKADGTRKACLVIQGCRDKELYLLKDTASPTLTVSSIRWFLANVLKLDWNITQYDVKNAFLNGIMECVKYASIPQGVDYDPRKFVCKL